MEDFLTFCTMILDYENYTEQEVNCLAISARDLSRLDTMNCKLILVLILLRIANGTAVLPLDRRVVLQGAVDGSLRLPQPPMAPPPTGSNLRRHLVATPTWIAKSLRRRTRETCRIAMDSCRRQEAADPTLTPMIQTQTTKLTQQR